MFRLTADTPKVRVAICVALFVATFVLFARTLGHEFVNYDDPDYVTENSHVKAGITLEGIKWAFRSSEASNWHPLTWMSHMLDVALFGENPRGHHATSVLLHALNAVVAFAAIYRLTARLWPAAVLAALFAWHPLRVESVAWVAERKDVLSGFFGLVTLWAYARYVERRRRADRVGSGRFYGLALVAFALGLMSKPMLVTLPCVLLLLDFWPLARMPLGARAGMHPTENWSWLIGEKLPFFALSIGSCAVTYWAQKGGGSVSAAIDFDVRLANAVVAVVRYLGKLLWPFDLAVLYPHPGTWPARKVIACAVIVALLSVAALRQWRRRPWVTVGWLWFLGTLVPVSGLVQVGLQSMADRYTYLPMLGVGIALIWTLLPGDRGTVQNATHANATNQRRSIERRPAMPISGMIGGAVLVAFAARTWNQLGVWRSSFTLFDHAIAVTEKNYLAHDNRGLFLFKAGRVEEAMADYRRALAINPSYLNANNNLGYAFAQLGRPAEAIPLYRIALQSNSRNLEVRNNLANALSDVGQVAEAMEHYDYVLARQPQHVNALNGSGVALAMQSRLPEARARLEEALRIAPNNPSAHNNLGNVCSMLGQRDEAIGHYRRAAELNPADPHPLVLMGTLFLQQEKFAEAAESFQRAVAVRADNPEAQAHLGLAYARLGRRDDALRSLQTALKQKPDYAQARAWLEAVAASSTNR